MKKCGAIAILLLCAVFVLSTPSWAQVTDLGQLCMELTPDAAYPEERSYIYRLSLTSLGSGNFLLNGYASRHFSVGLINWTRYKTVTGNATVTPDETIRINLTETSGWKSFVLTMGTSEMHSATVQILFFKSGTSRFETLETSKNTDGTVTTKYYAGDPAFIGCP